jgi:predicted Zn-dependent protease with MMP-like domain
VWFAKQAGPVTPPPAASLTLVDDRHARHRRADADPRRRPSDGFRADSAARFERLVGDALALAPVGLLRYLDDLEIVIELVPPVPSGLPVPPPLARYEAAGAGRQRGETAAGAGAAAGDRIRLYRRPLEARARNTADLRSLVLEAVVSQLADHHGLSEDDLDELGWW